MNESFLLQNYDHPSMVLVSAPLTGTNYLSWSRSMKIALRAKNKLGFINGKIDVSNIDSNEYEQWLKVDSIVFSWLLNSISKELVDALLYVAIAQDLWFELEKRFNECNGPLMYQLKRKISSFFQENMHVIVYFTKLKKLWDELSCLKDA